MGLQPKGDGMHKYQCPKCGQTFKTEVVQTTPPICARDDRRVTHPVVMVKVVTPTPQPA
jgi:rubrerythrin